MKWTTLCGAGTTVYSSSATMISRLHMNSSGIYSLWNFWRQRRSYEWILYWWDDFVNHSSHFIHHTMTMKIWSGLIGVCCVVLLSGCGSSSDTTDTLLSLWGSSLSVTIPDSFEEIPSRLVENRQITNQILYSGKEPLSASQIEQGQTYSLNLVVTQSSIATWITYDQFAQTNMDKMQQYMIWYQKKETTLENFDCGDEAISWIHSLFDIKDSYHQPNGTYSFHHYQFVYDNQWYIISLAGLPSESRTLTKTFKTITDSLGCNWN